MSAVRSTAYIRLCEQAGGGMGYVEIVVRKEGRFQRLCARKRLHPQYRSDDGFRSMFLDEARMAGLIRHAHVVSVLDVGEDDEGPFIVMEYVEGITAADLRGYGKGLPVQIAVRVVLEAARGLHAAHESTGDDGQPLGLVHRDVSAQNILIGFDGLVRVTDFGIAKALGNVSHTRTGLLKGNLGYISPEQLRFEPVDRRADLFSLGVILYELLAGERLYVNTSEFDGPRRILHEPPPDIGDVRDDVPPELVELLFELLAKERERRPPTAAAVAARLETILAALVEQDVPIELGEFVCRHFEEARREQQARIAAALERVAVTDTAAPATGRRRVRRVALGAAGVALLALGGLLLARAPPGGAGKGARPGQGRTVWTGAWHTCAFERGRLHCWGKNNEGQLGAGHSVDWNTPLAVRWGEGAPVSMGLGFFHSCACTADGRLHCWGANADGQLGLGDTRPRRTPTAVSSVTDCAQVAAGPYHTCVLRRGGTVACFGRNDRGQAGRPPSPPLLDPTAVDGLEQIVAVDAGGHARGGEVTCALARAGSVHCFGDARGGKLGGGAGAAGVPARVPGLDDAAEIAVGGHLACARRRGGRVACWGGNAHGELGDGTRTPRSTPAAVARLEDVVQIDAGLNHACALRASGELLCWGDNEHGQLGDDTGRSANRPVRVTDIQRFLSVSLGDVHSCGRHAAGVACWGENHTGQVGDGTTNNRRFRPVSAAGF